MLLTFDIGNTNIVMGVFPNDGDELIASWRMQTDTRRSADELGVTVYQMLELEGITREDISDVVVSSVVPQVMYSMLRMIQKFFGIDPMVIGPGTRTGIHIRYDNPRQVGADRIVNAVAGVKKYGAPLIIVDFGTATTFCAINRDSQYLGGSIYPGIRISSEALYEKAAKLTRVELVKMDKVICTNTTQSIQAGVFFGYIGSVDAIVTRMKEELGGGEIKVIATGGFAQLIKQGSQQIDLIDPSLTLHGLNILYHMNEKKSRNNYLGGIFE